jgi:hypothetical protein
MSPQLLPQLGRLLLHLVRLQKLLCQRPFFAAVVVAKSLAIVEGFDKLGTDKLLATVLRREIGEFGE